VRDCFQDIGQEPLAVFNHSFLVAGWTKVSAFTRKTKDELMVAGVIFDSCETTVKVAAIQIAMDDIYYMRSPEPNARGISIVPDLFEFFEMAFYALVVGAGAEITGAINVSKAANIGC
jgi:hypothetical protein